MASPQDPWDLVVVGAGWFGLVMAKTYLQINPGSRVVLLDNRPSLGGVWSHEQLYPGLKANNMPPGFEYHDFPMDKKRHGIQDKHHVTGESVNLYLNDYAEHFDLVRRLQLNTTVTLAERQADHSWILTLSSSVTPAQASTMHARRIVIATGMASEPNYLQFPNEEVFKGSIFHFSEFGKRGSTRTIARNAVVIGSAKSAYDAAYDYASTGTHVHWVIRPDGVGPSWMAPPYVTPFKLGIERLLLTRLLQWMSPCIWADGNVFGGWVRRMLHNTWLGRKFVDGFWGVLQSDVVQANNYNRDAECKKLTPWTSSFWVGSMLSLLNHSHDIFDYVHQGRISVHIASIQEMLPTGARLTNGETIDADVICCATGWKHKPTIQFLPKGIDKDLGIPYHARDPKLSDIDLAADAEIKRRLPRLKDQPTVTRRPAVTFTTSAGKEEETLNQPYRQYRYMVPPTDTEYRTIAFAGFLIGISTALLSQTQALWITAYFAGAHLPTDPLQDRTKKDVEWETSLHNRWTRWRYPVGFGARFPDFVFETIPYVELLFRDLGLNPYRGKHWWNNLFSPNYSPLFKGFVDEWQTMHPSTSKTVMSGNGDVKMNGHAKGANGKAY